MPAKSGLVPITAFALLFVGAAPAGAQEAPATTPAASVDRVGWWNVSRGPQPGEPDNPLRPALAPVPAPPTNVPADAIGVGAALGEPTKVAAVGLLLEGADGGTVDRLTLTLKESSAPGANLAADGAGIVACPITAFWGETRNGNWVDRPEADCALASADGVRAADGTWTFDLTTLATAAGWLDPASSVGQNGVLLAEKVDAPAGFEVSLLDPAAGGVTLDFAATGGGDVTDPFAGTGDTGGAAGSFDLGTVEPTFPSGDLGRTDPFTLAPVPSPSSGAPGTATSGGGDPAPRPPRRPVLPAASTGGAGDLVGNLSSATYVLIPLALAAALVLSLYLGADRVAPAGDAPAHTITHGRRRLGGVARALARRERAEVPTSPTTDPMPWSTS